MPVVNCTTYLLIRERDDIRTGRLRLPLLVQILRTNVECRVMSIQKWEPGKEDLCFR